MKLFIRGLKAVAIIEDENSPILVKEGEYLVDFPEEIALEDMTEEFIGILLSDGVEAARASVAPNPYPKEISLWRFRNRFTFEQRVEIESSRSTDPVIETLMKDLESVRDSMVSLDIPETIQGIGILVSKKIITESRAAYVLHYGVGEPPAPDDTFPVEEPPAEDPPVEGA